MGWNTSMIIMNDSLHDIERDPEFGKKVSEAASRLSIPKEHRGFGALNIRSGYSANAATVIEHHHADDTAVIAVGGNRGVVLGTVFVRDVGSTDEPEEVRILRALAKTLGFQLVKKQVSSTIVAPGR